MPELNKCRARREVLERRHELVEPHGLVGGGGEATRHPQQEVLRRLDDLAVLGVAQQVAVVHRAEAEELEQVVALGVDGVVELAGVDRDELGRLVADEPELVADLDGLGERVDVLVLHLLVHVGGQQASRELGVVRLLDDEGGRGADGQLVELLGRGPVAQPADGAGRHPHGVDAGEALTTPLDGPDDLGDVDRLESAVALADPHARVVALDDGGVVGVAQVDRRGVADGLLGECHALSSLSPGLPGVIRVSPVSPPPAGSGPADFPLLTGGGGENRLLRSRKKPGPSRAGALPADPSPQTPGTPLQRGLALR